MSWKSIEMQVALPRTQDAGKIQEQMQKSGQQFQEALGQTREKQQEIKRSKVSESEDTNGVRDQNDDKTFSDDSHDKQSDKPEYESVLDHPYLGKRIDFNG